MNPLKARGRALGTLTFLYHRVDLAEVASLFLADLADRAALAIDTSTLYEQRRRHVVSSSGICCRESYRGFRVSL